ncbi:MAG: TonB-dependent receptor [Longimicrobiales bacterium]
MTSPVTAVRRAGICLTLMAALQPAHLAGQDGAGAVSGRVTGSAAGDTVALPHAVIEVMGANRRATTADADGYYTLSGIAEGRAQIRVLHSGHDPLELFVVVSTADTLRLDFHLSGAPVDLGEIEVEGETGSDPDRQPDDLPPGVARLETEALRTTSGIAEMGLAAAARRASGNDPTDPNALLFMRGSTTDLKLVLLDGAPIHTPFHLGGLLDPIQPRMVGRTQLFLGGAPARYNGGISHILDIETRRPSSGPARGQVSADLMGLSGVLEKGGDRASLLASGRLLHGAANALLADGPQPYGYSDGLVRGDIELGPGHLSVTAFRNHESVSLDPVLGLENQGVSLAGPDAVTNAASTDAMWSNGVLSGRYKVDLAEWNLGATVAVSDYDATLPVGDTTLTIIGGSSTKLHFALDANRRTRWGSASVGASFDDMTVRERTDQIVGPSPGLSSRSIRGRVAGGYVEANRNFGGVTLRGGLRADAFEHHNQMEFSPRASLLVPLSETALFRLAAGRFSQLSRRSDPAIPSELGIQSPGFQDEPLLGVATASHLVASIDQRLSPDLTVGLEGFVKSFNGLPDAGGDRVQASGMDLRIARSDDRYDGWLGYTLTWFWSDAGSLSNARFSGHHLLTAGLTGPVGRFLDGSVRFSYGSGLPFSSVPFGDAGLDADSPGEETPIAASGNDPVVPVPDESFLRVDFTLTGRWSLGQSNGRSVMLHPYVRVLNALDRRDSLFYYFEPWRTESPRPLAELPVLPVFGVRVTF